MICSEFMDCASMCADDACVSDCFSRTCPAGMTQYESLAMCIETSCATECAETGDPELCNTCVYASCDVEVTSCLSSGC